MSDRQTEARSVSRPLAILVGAVVGVFGVLLALRAVVPGSADIRVVLDLIRSMAWARAAEPVIAIGLTAATAILSAILIPVVTVVAVLGLRDAPLRSLPIATPAPCPRPTERPIHPPPESSHGVHASTRLPQQNSC
ncbi:MAG: hypothetical protein FJ280_04455 [Planctomycetes bacterium]|nr:hypothetical protein [Planctomycetota bacterium]